MSLEQKTEDVIEVVIEKNRENAHIKYNIRKRITLKNFSPNKITDFRKYLKVSRSP